MSDDRVDEILIRGLDKVDRKCDDIKDNVNSLNTKFATHEEQFRKHLETDERMYQELHRMNDILQSNTESLKEHMHRTELVEDTQSVQNQALLKIDSRLQVFEQERIKKEAVKEYMKESAKKWAMKISIAGTIVGILVGIAKLAGLL
jgi:L-lactate utilization protein LutB